MADLAARLLTCFTSVFPDLPAEAAPAASTDTVMAWDSMATVTLIMLIEEEFDVEIDLDDIADLSSFPRMATYLERKLGA